MVSAVVLAAGKGTRMKSDIPKVLHKLGSKALIEHVLEKVVPFSDEIIVVVGYKGELVEEFLKEKYPEIKTVLQKIQAGTAHAVKCAFPLISQEKVLILPGDMPFIKKESIKKLLDVLERENVAGALLAAEIDDPQGYGRVIEHNGYAVRIVEESDATNEERSIKTVNTGVYCFRKPILAKALEGIKPDNKKGEYYLTDAIKILYDLGYKVKTVKVSWREGMGVNDRRQLSEAYKRKCYDKALKLMESGVTVLCPEYTFVEDTVSVGKDTVIYPFVFIEGDTKIGSCCEIKPFSVIRDSLIDDNVIINEHCVIERAVIEKEVSVGPFARIRPDTRLKRRSRVGNFVEVKKSVIGENSKANHLAYIGDAKVGKNVNIGAGTITCNYDGVKKHETVIEDEVFIGSDTQLVAPVKVGRGALIGAGSTVTRDVPEDSLVITRAPMKILEGRGIKNYKKRKYGIED